MKTKLEGPSRATWTSLICLILGGGMLLTPVTVADGPLPDPSEAVPNLTLDAPTTEEARGPVLGLMGIALSDVQLVSPGHEWWLGNEADAVESQAPTFKWTSARAFTVYEVSIWDVAHTTIIRKAFVKAPPALNPRVAEPVSSHEATIEGLPACMLLEWQIAGGLGSSSFAWVAGPDGKQFYIKDATNPACDSPVLATRAMDFGPVRAYAVPMPDPVYGFGSSLGQTSGRESQQGSANLGGLGTNVPGSNRIPPEMTAGGGSTGGGETEERAMPIEARCFEWWGTTNSWCYGEAPEEGYLEAIAIIYCRMDSGDCETSGTIHANAQKTYGYGPPSNPYSGVWTFYTQFYNGGNTGCPDTNGCNSGTPGQKVNAIAGTLGDAIYGYNISNYMSGSSCSPSYYGSSQYVCTGQGGYGAYSKMHR